MRARAKPWRSSGWARKRQEKPRDLVHYGRIAHCADFSPIIASKGPIPSSGTAVTAGSPLGSKPSADAVKFKRLVEAWRTRILSSVQAKIFHPHYQSIMAMGPAALSYIFAELRERGGQWHWALECITGDNPAETASNVAETRDAWLTYAFEHGYIA